jgi:uncharacterized protein
MTELSLGQRAVLWCIGLYQAFAARRPSPCRFYPSCSAYAVEAVEQYGATRGGWLALRRLSRCHPLGGRGVDLVPVPVEKRPPGRDPS